MDPTKANVDMLVEQWNRAVAKKQAVVDMVIAALRELAPRLQGVALNTENLVVAGTLALPGQRVAELVTPVGRLHVSVGDGVHYCYEISTSKTTDWCTIFRDRLDMESIQDAVMEVLCGAAQNEKSADPDTDAPYFDSAADGDDVKDLSCRDC